MSNEKYEYLSRIFDDEIVFQYWLSTYTPIYSTYIGNFETLTYEFRMKRESGEFKVCVLRIFKRMSQPKLRKSAWKKIENCILVEE